MKLDYFIISATRQIDFRGLSSDALQTPSTEQNSGKSRDIKCPGEIRG